MKLCECGCGQPAPIAKWNDKRRGHVKGEPVRFVHGHHGRLPMRALYVEDLNTGCWMWTSSRMNMGYGEIRRDGRRWLAHRWMWTMKNGPIPEGKNLDHICRNPLCVNPDHLRLCTQAENLQNLSPEGRRGTSTYRGVSRDKASGKWAARVQIAGKVHLLGTFPDEDSAGAAAAAYRAEYMPFSMEATDAAA